jgi:predicted PurR-regulated permease PerM
MTKNIGSEGRTTMSTKNKLNDSIVISPLAVSRSVNVHPLMVIIVISFGGLLHGVWGMLLSVPLYCSMRVSLRILYRGFVEYGNW